MKNFDWNCLLSGARRRKLDSEKGVSDSSGYETIWSVDRTEIERDFDRVVFAAPIRRLANKTQVFPMEEHDSVRTRLTHSNEVSNLARGAGVSLCCNGFFEDVGIERDRLIREVPSLLATIGLVHDMGNPPFGHQGEKAIRDWFCNKLAEEEFRAFSKSSVFDDFKEFDGNAQTLRLVTRLHAADGDFGMDLTAAALSAMIKYPITNNCLENSGYEKAGVFESEVEVARQVWSLTGLSEGVRHPLTYVMEACDDIAYATIDAEDTIKKGYASFYDLKNFLSSQEVNATFFTEIYKKIESSIESFKARGGGDITSDIESEVSMEIFRSLVIHEFLKKATDQFKEDFHSGKCSSQLINGKKSCYEIVKNFGYSAEIKALKNFSRHYGFNNQSVLRLELEGRGYINQMMNYLWDGVKNMTPDLQGDTHYEKYIVSKISKNYLREFRRKLGEAKSEEQRYYAKFQLITDFVSGMTETYLARSCEDIRPFIRKFE